VTLANKLPPPVDDDTSVSSVVFPAPALTCHRRDLATEVPNWLTSVSDGASVYDVMNPIHICYSISFIFELLHHTYLVSRILVQK
jgi:hypothetical protein